MIWSGGGVKFSALFETKNWSDCWTSINSVAYFSAEDNLHFKNGKYYIWYESAAVYNSVCIEAVIVLWWFFEAIVPMFMVFETIFVLV